MQLQKWNNTTAVINWFKKIEKKNKYKFKIFEIKNFYSSSSTKLLNDSINLVQQKVLIKRENFNIIQHARKSGLSNKEIPWQKKKPQPFKCRNGSLPWS